MNYVFLEQIVPQLPPTTSAEESNDESQDPNILFCISSDELEKKMHEVRVRTPSTAFLY